MYDFTLIDPKYKGALSVCWALVFISTCNVYSLLPPSLEYWTAQLGGAVQTSPAVLAIGDLGGLLAVVAASYWIHLTGIKQYLVIVAAISASGKILYACSSFTKYSWMAVTGRALMGCCAGYQAAVFVWLYLSVRPNFLIPLLSTCQLFVVLGEVSGVLLGFLLQLLGLAFGGTAAQYMNPAVLCSWIMAIAHLVLLGILFFAFDDPMRDDRIQMCHCEPSTTYGTATPARPPTAHVGVTSQPSIPNPAHVGHFVRVAHRERQLKNLFFIIVIYAMCTAVLWMMLSVISPLGVMSMHWDFVTASSAYLGVCTALAFSYAWYKKLSEWVAVSNIVLFASSMSIIGMFLLLDFSSGQQSLGERVMLHFGAALVCAGYFTARAAILAPFIKTCVENLYAQITGAGCALLITVCMMRGVGLCFGSLIMNTKCTAELRIGDDDHWLAIAHGHCDLGGMNESVVVSLVLTALQTGLAWFTLRRRTRAAAFPTASFGEATYKSIESPLGIQEDSKSRKAGTPKVKASDKKRDFSKSPDPKLTTPLHTTYDGN